MNVLETASEIVFALQRFALVGSCWRSRHPIQAFSPLNSLCDKYKMKVCFEYMIVSQELALDEEYYCT
jgi:hypothetical protein